MNKEDSKSKETRERCGREGCGRAKMAEAAMRNKNVVARLIKFYSLIGCG